MKLNLKNLSIPQQILTIAIILSAVLLIFVLSFSVNQILTSKNSIKTSLNKNRSFAVIEKIDRNFYERFGDVQAYAYNKLAVETLTQDSISRSGQDFINTMVRYYVLYDLMMMVNKDGKVIAANTVDKNNIPLRTESLIGKDFSHEAWFRVCMSPQGPEGGAWYSDFTENKSVAQLYNHRGWGMAFTAPIKNETDQTIGVWFNYANWTDVTQGIRKETEDLLKQEEPDAFILITDKHGKVIDAADENLVNSLQIVQGDLDRNEFSFVSQGKKITSDDYIVSMAQGKGAYTYKGNDWKVLTLVPKSNFSFSILLNELSTFSIAIVAILIAGIITFLLLSRRISQKISKLQDGITSVSNGELIEIEKSSQSDEIGHMTNSVKTLVDGLRKTALFANEIGSGNLDSRFEPLSDKDVLGMSLVTMRNNLYSIRKQEEKRQWVTQGLAEFGECIRKQDNQGMSSLCDQIVVFLCKYLKANQAALFIKDEDEEKPSLEVAALYAWDRKKFQTQKISPGEGLVGQVWQEGEMLFMLSVPNNYIKITSGLGEANPGALIIIPLKNNHEVLGVLEIASFIPFEEHEREFLQKIADSLASTLASARINDKTRRLLEQTQQQAEEMKSQEEEMRQNLEEMQATQEAFLRREKDYQLEIENLTGAAVHVNQKL
jgi:HAMP domain-containing protein